MTKAEVVIVAAGRGLRAGGNIPKQYVRLANRYVLTRTIEAFLSHPAVERILTVIHPDDHELYEAATVDFRERLMPPIYGGETRQQSVYYGLLALASKKTDIVLIQDAARPFTDATIIDRVIKALANHSCVLPVIPISDTIKRVENGNVAVTIDRSSLFAAQTPQGFKFKTILDVHERARRAVTSQFTDDASLAEWAGIPVFAVEGNIANKKLTTGADMELAELILKQQENKITEIRIGTGFDVHRFEPGDSVILCGVNIPHEQKLQGHSDADVAMHALTDALLGTIGAGDIGNHFPQSDPLWKGAASQEFLAKAMKLVHAANGRLINVDVTIICESPRIGAHREAMRSNLARILQVSVERISVKATTTEGLGYTGRREGIAAQAVASIELSTGPAGLE